MDNLLKELELVEGDTPYLLKVYDEATANKVGILSDLETENKSNIVSAINENKDRTDGADNNITNINNSIQTINGNIDTINGNIDNIDGNITSLISSISDLRNTIPDILDVTKHGIVGDGLTNNGTAFATLLTNYPNKTYYFPKGTYVFTGSSFSGNIKLFGLKDCTLVDFTYENLNMPIISKENTFDINQDFFSAEGIRFTNTGSNYGLYIHVQSQGSVLRTFDIRDCIFYGTNGLKLQNCITGNIHSCDFVHLVRGILSLSSTNITIDGCNWYSPVIGIDIDVANDDTVGRTGGESIMLTACQFIDGVCAIKSYRHNYLELINCMIDYFNCCLFLNGSRYARLVNTYLGYDDGDKSSMSGYMSPPNYGCLYGYSNVSGIPFSFEAINSEFVAYSNTQHIPVVADGSGTTAGEDIDIVACRFTAMSTSDFTTLLYLNTCSDCYVEGNRYYAPSNNNLEYPYVFSNCSRVINSNNDYANCFKSGGTSILPSATNKVNNNTYQECIRVTLTGDNSSPLIVQHINFNSTYDSSPIVTGNVTGGTDNYKCIVTFGGVSSSGCDVMLYNSQLGNLSGDYTVDIIVMHSMY